MPDFVKLLYCRILAYASREEGQGVAEYALIIALVAIVTIVALQFLGGGIRHTYTVAANGT
jgi:Flp pilus assembly pilin Flp